MLNAIKLSELLAKNVDPQLYPRMFIMSPNGTLMAYSTPVDIKDLRDQAALISMAWKEHEASVRHRQSSSNAASEQTSASQDLETLTIEFQHNNIIVRAIQAKLLLVLVGGVPPSRKSVFKITPEAHGDARYPPSASSSEDEGPETEAAEGAIAAGVSLEVHDGPKRAASISSTLSQKEKDVKHGALHIQRKKIDALTKFIRKEFDEQGFVMPDDSNFP